jgi:hypothetical protein
MDALPAIGCVLQSAPMPTPFMHMALAHRLIADPVLPSTARDLLRTSWGAFLLGSIAPDARVSSGISRVDTHFFDYAPVINPPPAAAMIARHSALRRAVVQDSAQAAFLAGYLGHLAMDEVWCTDLLFPSFVQPDWGSQLARLLSLHVLLSYLDERDRQKLAPTDFDQLVATTPRDWLPFMPDSALTGWRDLIAPQIAPGGESQTFNILGKRVGMSGADLAALSIHEMNGHVWSNVPPSRVATVEEAMYDATRRTVLSYLDGSL